MSRNDYYDFRLRKSVNTINTSIALLSERKGLKAELLSVDPLYDMIGRSNNPANLTRRIIRALGSVGNALGRGHFVNGEKGKIIESHWDMAFERLEALSRGDEGGLHNPHRQWSSDRSDSSD